MSEAMEVRREYRLREWTRIIQECQASGLSNREYCRQKGISEKTYYYRLRQLREAAIARTEHSGTLVRLEDDQSQDEKSSAAPEQMLRIQYCGARLELPGSVDMDAVAALLRSIQRHD